jgi:hypothetical protein
MENHFTESVESTFLAPSLLVHFKKSLHKINRELLLFEKLFGRVSASRALSNRSLRVLSLSEKDVILTLEESNILRFDKSYIKILAFMIQISIVKLMIKYFF